MSKISNPQKSNSLDAANSSKSLKALGENIWKNNMVKINSELFTLTYGSVVSQLITDYQRDFTKVNDHLFMMGRSMGVRLIEDFAARTALPRCEDMVQTSEVISKVAFTIFLNITPQVTNWNTNKDTFSLVLDENPLADFVQLPTDATKKLWYSNILCGVLKGALEMVQLDCKVWFVADVLREDSHTEIKIKLNRILKDEIPAGET